MESPDLRIHKLLTNQLGIEVGVISLNRPAALNALNHSMIDALERQLHLWASDDAIAMVIIKGNGERGYCAGGDIKALHDDNSVTFLAKEYRLDFALYTYPKPIVHLMHGYVMGGGIGLMASGALKLCIADAVFAMPETAIGFFPDVGYRYQLARLPRGLGAWLGLTGAYFTPKLAQALHIVDHIIPKQDRNILVSHLYERVSQWREADGPIVDFVAKWAVEQAKTDVDIEYASEDDAFDLGGASWSDQPLLVPKAIHDWCDFYWDYPDVPWYDDLVALAKYYATTHPDLFTLDPRGIDHQSPLSICMTDIMLKRSINHDLQKVFEEDYWLAAKLYKDGDLREGILAKVIEKREPKWRYSKEQLTSQLIAGFTPPAVIASVLRKKIVWGITH
mgnify:CR=1 FL=1